MSRAEKGGKLFEKKFEKKYGIRGTDVTKGLIPSSVEYNLGKEKWYHSDLIGRLQTGPAVCKTEQDFAEFS